MTTTNNESKIYVSFHIGCGGKFNNPGHLTFHGEEDFQDLIKRCSDVSIIISEDEEGNTLPDSDWQLLDTGSNVVLRGRDAIEDMTGRLEWDTIYNTDYVTTTDDLSANELDAIWKAYLNEERMSDELKDFICTEMGYKRLHSFKKYKDNMIVFTQSGFTTFTDLLMQAGEFTRDEWKNSLEEEGFCPLSVEKILDELESYYTEESDFYKDED